MLKAITRKTNKGKEQVLVQVYDLENEIGKEIEINLNFVKLEGMNQINLKNNLFLCGSANEEEEKGSKLVRIDLMNLVASYSILVSSLYSHYCPSMTNFRNEFILIIGGKKSLKCEYFELTSGKWLSLPDLPEERYRATVVCDEVTQSVYLFGGFNSNSNKIYSSVLKLNLKSKDEWQTILVTPSLSSLTSKVNTGVCRVDRSTVLILGGKTNSEDATDEAIECYLLNKPNLSTRLAFKLPSNSLFSTMTFACETETHHFIFDDNSQIIKISKFDQTVSLSSFFDKKEYNEPIN